MARIDSLILVMLGVAQMLIGNSVTLEFIGVLLQGTGGGTIVMAIYFLIFLSKHQKEFDGCLLYTSPSPRDATLSRMPSSA